MIYARKENPEIEQRERNEEEVAELLSLAMRVEGIVRNVGMHAGGVLIAPGKITDFCPLYMQPGSDSAVSMFDKDDVEAIGLVKFDFLGLATLTILELTRKLIRERHADRRDFEFESLPLDDRATYRADGRGQDGRRVPARKLGHAAHAARRQAERVRGRDRPRRAVPAGPDGPDPDLLRAQARPRRSVLSAPADGGGAEGDLRRSWSTRNR